MLTFVSSVTKTVSVLVTPRASSSPPPYLVALKVTASNACLYCATVPGPVSFSSPVEVLKAAVIGLPAIGA